MSFDVDQAFQQARTLQAAGCPAEAEAIYRQILAVDPAHVDSLHLLGVAAYQTGRPDEAFDLIGRAIALNGRAADFHCNMGLVLSQLGRLNEAIASYRQAIALEPRHTFSHNNLGNALAELKRSQEAEGSFRRAIEIDPGYAEAYCNLANALGAQCRFDDAVALYRQALTIAPHLINALNNLGTFLEQQGKLDEAVVAYTRAIELDSCDSRVHYNFANALRTQGNYDDAIAHYKQCLVGWPNYADAWNNLGGALAERGDLDAARDAYQRAVDSDPTRAAYHRNLANSKRFEQGDPQLEVMEQLQRNPASVPERERVDLQFALGKAYEDLGQHERSFGHLLAGNKVKRALIHYDEAGALEYMQRIRTVFDTALLAEKAGRGEPSAIPVFVVGMPRSGTTLIEQIIASHPQAEGAGELFDLDNIVQDLPHRYGGGLNFPELVTTMSAEDLGRVGARYVTAVKEMAPAASRIVDKMPWNFHFLGLISLALPNARIIHARRDPVDTCLSCFSILFEGDANAFSYDLGELGRFYRGYQALMAHWRAVLPPGLMLEVKYEDVVADLETQARAIVAHCGLEWDDVCLAFHKTRRHVRTSSVTQVRRPIYRSSVGRWQPYRNQLRPLIVELGRSDE